eukprot:GHVN01062574.1.p1 GENE.GHVN01062574.1~~GHVN01062574.1.p1  ORF type:complete len:431 (+),score=75.40 GHVN01062574.1:84-1376(+)
MALSRPLVSVYRTDDPTKTKDGLVLPTVFEVPIRPDLVNFVYDQMSKNKRQAYAVSANAGYQTSAESWGTGRAVARIPRVPGGGTHRAGQGAFGNMCRGGGMFSPTKVWRRWHRHINRTQRRHAAASAVAATGVPALIQARGHRIDDVSEFPLVISDDVQTLTRTKHAQSVLESLGLKEELAKVVDSRHMRAGKGKRRNRRFIQAKGPLVIYESDNGITRAFRNIPGVELCCVERLNLLKLAPGGHLGRLTIWTEGAFAKLATIFGDYTSGSPTKNNYTMPRPLLANSDISRLINSDEIQLVVNPAKDNVKDTYSANFNPLRNHRAMIKMNPAAGKIKRFARRAQTEGTAEHKAVQKRKAERLPANKAALKRARLEAKMLKTTFDEKHAADDVAAREAKEAALKASALAARQAEGMALDDGSQEEDDDEE